jgi:hypothetical protein
VRINAVGMPDKGAGVPLAKEAERLVASCAAFAKRATDAVEKQL